MITETPIPQNQNFDNIPSKRHTGFGFYHRGRASRKTFWIQTLVMVAISLVVYISTFIVIGAAISPDSLSETAVTTYSIFGFLFLFVYTIMYMYYGFTLAIRRVHDFGCSAWLALLIFIPNAGIIPWIIFGCIPSEEKPNKYGTQPDVI